MKYLGSVYHGIRRGFYSFSFLTLIAFSLQATAQNGQLQVLPSSINFGTVTVGNSQTVSITLTNTGGPKITVIQGNVSGSEFAVCGMNYPFTLAGGQSTTCSVTFSPTSAGPTNGSVNFVYESKWGRNNNNGSNPQASASLSGTGQSLGQLTGNPTSLNFGNVQVGSSNTLTETVTNTGGANVKISAATVSGAGFSETGPAMPFTLSVGQSANFNVTFSPSSSGSSTGNLAITSDASNPTLNVALSGTGVTPAVLSANPTSLSFGSIATGSSSTLGETLTNTGGSTLTISQITTTGAGFSYSGITPPVTLTAGQYVNLSVIFAPQAGGNASGNLAVNSNASNPTLNVPLTGTGVAPGQLGVSPASVSFGNVVVGTSQSQSASLSASNGPVTVTSATVSEAEFSLSGITFPVTIPSGQSVPYSVVFAPTASGSASANITFSSNAPNSPVVQTANGSGTPPPQHSVSLTWDASTSANVVGYNVYRGTVSGGPYTEINSGLVPNTSYTDNTVAAGQTYYYVTTSVDSAGVESGYSNQTTAVIPTP